MDVHVYTVEDAEGSEDTFWTYDYNEAREHARKNKLRVIDNEYEFADSSMVDDFTGKEEA